MSQILKKVKEVDPNNSDAVRDTLATFFQSLTKHTDSDSNRWLRALGSVINRFPKYCSTHRITIETYLVHFVDTSNYFNAIEAAKCAHTLQQVRPSQEKAATAKICWREHMIIVCNAAHKLLSLLFPNSVDIYKEIDNGQKTQLQSSSTSPLYIALLQDGSARPQNNVNKQNIVSTRLRNVFVLLQAMLVEIYPVGKPVQPQMILEVIVRALSISSGKNSNLDACTIAEIKTQALRTLDALVACLGSNLIPYSSLIIKFVMQTLKWSTEHPSEESRKVRCSAYGSLSGWLRALRSHCPGGGGAGCGGGGGEAGAWPEQLAAHVIGDVTPRKHVVQLTMNSQPTKHLSKKAKRKLANSMLQESSIASHMPGEKNKIPVSEESDDDVAIAALECAETFLIVCGIFLKPAIHKVLQERIIRECYTLSRYTVGRGAALLRALEALRKAATPHLPPPTQHCLQLYSCLLDGSPGEISRICSEALLDIRLHLHCSPPSLNFALEPQQQQKKPTEKRKKISERNRAALESLLGKRMPETDLTEDEVIDIPDDEPVNKKRRPTIEDDKISLSSESDDDSVEIQNECEIVSEASVDLQQKGIDEEDSGGKTVDVEIEEVSNGVLLTSSQEEELNLPTQIEEVVDEEDRRELTDNPASQNETASVEKNDKVNIYEAETQRIIENNSNNAVARECSPTDKIDASPTDNIYEAKTQMPLNVSNDTVDGERSPLSMEVGYDFPSTGKDKVTVLEKIDDENLPSTSDTDDIQITCGQVVKGSQDAEIDKSKEVEEGKENVEPKVNGDKSPEKNQFDTEMIAVKTVAIKDVTVEDMLADFVDEVIDEPEAEA